MQVPLVPLDAIRNIFGVWYDEELGIMCRRFPGEVTEGGVEAGTLVGFVMQSYPNNKGRPTRALLEIIAKAKAACGPDVAGMFDEALAERFGQLETKVRGAGNEGKKSEKPISQQHGYLGIKSHYSVDELLKAGVITAKELESLRESGWANLYGSVPRFQLATALVTLERPATYLGKLGFKDAKQTGIGMASLEKVLANAAATGLSEDERGALGVLEAGGLQHLSGLVEEFYRKGKPFMASPEVTLFWIAATVIQNSRQLKDEARIRSYAGQVQAALGKYTAIWERNAAILGRSIEATPFNDIKHFLANRLTRTSTW